MDSRQIYEDKTAGILLIAASLALAISGGFNVAQFSVQYGIGVGAILQSNSTHVNVTALLQPTAVQLRAIYQTILESFLLAGIAVAMLAMALILLINPPDGYESYLRRYVPLHIMLAVIYIMLLFIIHSTFPFSFYSIQMYVAYIALVLCIVLDGYLEYGLHRGTARRESGISINPSTPYANMVMLKDQFFNGLVGQVGIVDKHFNSNAIANLHRLIPAGDSGIKNIRIITSAEMLDSEFGDNYRDLKSELKNREIDVELKVMRDDDSPVQHERFIVDQMKAYKIPPLNIINRKSEHIVEMDHKEAERRFEYLYQRGIKLENYMEKRSRTGSTP